MAFKDLFIFPMYVLLAFLMLYFWQKITGNKGRRWKVALTFKLFSALFIGLLYAFYYGGGDTFNFFYHSEQIWSAILKDPVAGFKVLFTHGNYYPEVGEFIRNMWWYKDQSSMMVSRISAFFGLFSFHSYLGISVFFACISFFASYSIYRVFSDLRPQLDRYIFLIAFFIPSTGAWGSGLVKDTISLAAASFIIYSFYFALIKRLKIIPNLILFFIAAYFLSIIKVYILISLLPGLLIWLVFVNISAIKSRFIRSLITPILLVISLASGYTIINQITSENQRYALENISQTAKITAMDIYAGWGAGSTSSYFLGAQDGSLSNFIQLTPSAIVVALFRPWPWEIKNAIMVFSALESFFFLLATLYVLFKVGLFSMIKIVFKNPPILFCLTFSLVLAVGVGIASYNFGTLSRYKIPLLPFYLMALLFILENHIRSLKKT